MDGVIIITGISVLISMMIRVMNATIQDFVKLILVGPLIIGGDGGIIRVRVNTASC